MTATALNPSTLPPGTRFRRVVVVGLGYVGLPTALAFARAGLDVVGCDVNAARVAELAAGELTWMNEPEIQALFREPFVRDHLVAQAVPAPADAFVLAVPTPLDRRRKQADLRYVRAATESILPFLRRGNLVVVESTVPPLTCREVVAPLIESAGLSTSGDSPDVLLAHCPERVLPGNILHEIVHNDRIIGGLTPDGARAAAELYGAFVKGEMNLTDDVTAELCKLMENTYRDVNIALANEFAAVAERLGVDAKQASRLASRHPRVHILTPGIGVGGHCIPVDPWFIHEVDAENTQLIAAARAVNDAMPAKIAAKIRRRLAHLRSPRIVALGATYKPDTYDLRESPALEIVRLLRDDGYEVSVYDPLTEEYAGPSIREVARGADCLVLLVSHQALVRELEEHRDEILASMRHPILLTF